MEFLDYYWAIFKTRDMFLLMGSSWYYYMVVTYWEAEMTSNSFDAQQTMRALIYREALLQWIS